MMMIQRHLQTTCCIPFVETFITATSSSWRMIDTIDAVNESIGDHHHHHCRSIHHHITHPFIRRNRSYRYSSPSSLSSSLMCITTSSNDEPSDSSRRRQPRRRRSWMMNHPYQNIQGNRFVRSFTSWWRGGESNSKSSSSNTGSDSSDSSHKSSSSTRRANVDVSKKPRDSSSSYPMYLLRRYNEYPVSTCSIQGYRHYMEDEYMIHTSTSTKNPMPDTSNSHNNSITGTYSTIHRSVRNYDMISTSNTEDKIIHEEYGIIGCFDGHGGNAVSRYLRQNLFKNIQAALYMIQMTKPQQSPSQQEGEQEQSSSPADDDTQSKVEVQKQQVSEQLEDITTHDDYTSHPDETIDAKLQSQQQEEDIIHDNDEKKKSNNDQNQQFICHEDNEIKYEQFLTNYLPDSIVDSMIAATTPDTSKPTVITVEDYISALEVALDKVDREVLKVKHWSQQGSTAIVCWIHTEPIEDYELKQKDYTDQRSNKSKRKELKQQKRQPHPIHRTIITANIGDSRAILCRNGTAIALSRDHKPNDPIERKRIEQLGGTVVWSGDVDRMKEPIPGMGCYRVNNALAISRAIGDRMERPFVTSDPDITVISILPEYDEFIVVATDGLWDVMSSNDTVAFIRALLHNTMDDGDTIDRDTIATYVVEEALRRGSFDNITVMIVWLQ